MARKRKPNERKLRTREHVLADLSINHVERHIFLCGFAVNRLFADYGFDLLMLTYTKQGEVENGHVFFQIKATDSLQVLKDGQTVSFRVETADLKLWQQEWYPVILAVFDGQQEIAYWLYVQEYLDEKNVSYDDLSIDQDRVTIRIPAKNRLNRKAVEKFRQYRNERLNSMKGG